MTIMHRFIISVREEAVKLVGGFVLKGYDISAGPYLDGLIVRLRDKGVSVRKTVVGILKDTLLFQPDHPRYRYMLHTTCNIPKDMSLYIM